MTKRKQYKGWRLTKYKDGTIDAFNPDPGKKGGQFEVSKGGFTAAKKYIDKRTKTTKKRVSSTRKPKKSKSIFDVTINDLF